MKDLASNGFLTEAMPYTKNQLELAVADGNPHGIGDGVMPAGVTPKGDAVVDKIVDTVFDLLDPNVPVSEVDHINEGIHSAINGMYQSMDAYVRANGTASQIDELDARLAAVAVPQDGSPGKTRPATEGIKTNFNLASNAACNYGNGTLKFCEFAILNKANTHETRVHHVETPTLVRSGDSYTGPLWVTEVKYAQKAQDADASLGKLVGIGVNNAVNTPQVYSIALLATSGDATLANSFINWVRSAEGQQVYVDGGFLPLSDAELAGGKCYSLVNGALSETNRANNLCP